MHIPEGVLSVTTQHGVLVVSTSGVGVLCAGAVLSAAGTIAGLRKMDYEQVPRVAMLSAAFFVASLIHVPLGFTSAHLVLNGLVGLILGWAAFPALFVALLLQAVFFGYGGLTTLGINTLTMALPAVACHYLFRRGVRSDWEPLVFSVGFAAGALAIIGAALLTASALLACGKAFSTVSHAVLIAHLPIAVIEGFVTGSIVVFLRKVRPELLDAPLLVPRQLEVSGA